MADYTSVHPTAQRLGADEQDGQLNVHDVAGPSNDSPKKRKRSRKGDTDKKFECKHEGCGKSYSRAEHLYRHQLNHAPKEIYHCGFANCHRTFVRQDLCLRHRERHTTLGSQLQKRDSFPFSANTPTSASGQLDDASNSQGGHDTTPVMSPTEGVVSPRSVARSQLAPQSPVNQKKTMAPTYLNTAVHSGVPSSTASLEPHLQPSTTQTTYSRSDPQRKEHSNRSAGNGAHITNPQVYRSSHRPSYGTYDAQRYHSASFGSSDASGATNTPHPLGPRQMSTSVPSPSVSNAYMQSTGTIVNDPNQRARANNYFPPQNLHASSLPSSDLVEATLSQTPNAPVAAAIPNGIGGIDPVAGVMDTSVSDLDSMGGYALSIFGEETLNRSPFAMADDFTAWLFNDNTTPSSTINYPPASGMMSGYTDPYSTPLQNQYYPSEAAFGGYLANVIQHQQPLQQQQQPPPQQHQQQQQQDPMSVTSILDSGPPHSIISEDKRSDLIYLMQSRFNETDQAAVKKRKDALMDGNMDSDNHILSLRMMQTYIASYWHHSHQQLPILHKPTFIADKTPNLLLLAVLAIGAATLDKDHGQAMTDMAAELANFIAWHMRWEIFQDADFRPPAKLWVFQTLLLLEAYEKMHSTRALHERAHIHHDTTLTLMRRGSSLIGRSAFDSPPSLREDRQTRSTTGSGANSASEPGAGEESWTHWIKAEATRRVAFAAFVLDSTHATMFGHSAKMVAHEMRLPLPCDEALWSATSAAEVARVQSSLHYNGVRPTIFLDALKKTLNGQRVRTNSFGRTIIMAGLLSVSWHMNQRDLQVTSLGGTQTLGGRDKWRSALIRAFDYWKRDFDETAVQQSPSPNYSPAFRQPYPAEEDVFFESRTVLHHLAHMASHVDVVDCQIFAGADRLLGRSITPKDYSSAREKMTQRWATKASARDAAFYALKFLCQVLLPDESLRSNPGQMTSPTEYSARDDFLVNRPWVLYQAALVTWCYGYALDGPIKPSPPPELISPIDQRRDMYAFLERVGSVRSPEDLDRIRNRNRCMGLLFVLRETFANSRWELLGEAANLLGRCIEKLKGIVPSAGATAGVVVGN